MNVPYRTVPAAARTRRGARRAIVAALTALCATAPLGPPPAWAAPAAPSVGPLPVDFSVVVDASASIGKEALAREAEAAALIGQGEISDRSRASVIGFGSAEKEGQQPVREVCPPTVVDAAGRQRISDCARRLTDREGAGLGPGTDFPAALTQALTRLKETGKEGTPKVVFLLTDGKLNVEDSPAYGADPAARKQEGEKRLREVLDRARREQVQIWPLGFGKGIDKEALQQMADGGYRNGCADVPGSRPRPEVVDGAADVDKALQSAFAAARCARVEEGTSSKPPGELTVDIPPIATDGSITVTKRDPRVTATYYDPKGRKVPLQGDFDGSRFEVSGQDGPVEALRVKDPLPGTWRVRLSAPPGHRDQPATVRAIWQGVLRSSVTLEPSAPRPGENVVVRMRLQTRRGVVITDPGQLAGVRAAAQLSGDGFEPVDVPLRDDGEDPDDRAGDVLYGASVTVPKTATGALRLTGAIAAPGVVGDRRPYDTRVSSGAALVAAGVTLENHGVHPGGSVTGKLVARNNDSRPHTLRLGLADQSTAAALRISPATVTVAPGAQEPVPFTVSFGAGAPPGDAGGRITVTDRTDGGREVGSAFLTVTVTPAPTWWDRWWWAVIGGAGLLLALAAVVAIRIWYGGVRSSLQGLVLELRRAGRSLDELQVPGQRPKKFWFAVEEPASDRPGLQLRNKRAAQVYRLRRKGDGLRLRGPDGKEQTVSRGAPARLAHDLELAVRGGSRADREPTGRGRTGQGRRPGTAAGSRVTAGLFGGRLGRGGSAAPGGVNGRGGRGAPANGTGRPAGTSGSAGPGGSGGGSGGAGGPSGYDSAF
ncbi:VWA domain-containing protein [Streptomyces chrestomyceticus]|uniref:VWA domain-containing protein n=1 Tax=Streptomyces chrestomyceticus TaxID=68185 RepID=UPI0036CC5DF1